MLQAKSLKRSAMRDAAGFCGAGDRQSDSARSTHVTTAVASGVEAFEWTPEDGIGAPGKAATRRCAW